jgi:hypothetical protein
MPSSSAKFESEAWLGEVLIRITGEAELETIRLADGRWVNKHYDLTKLVKSTRPRNTTEAASWPKRLDRDTGPGERRPQGEDDPGF